MWAGEESCALQPDGEDVFKEERSWVWVAGGEPIIVEG